MQYPSCLKKSLSSIFILPLGAKYLLWYCTYKEWWKTKNSYSRLSLNRNIVKFSVCSKQLLFCISGDELITERPVNTEVDKGNNVRFNCRVTVPEHLNAEGLRVKWKHNGHYIHPHDHSDKYVDEDQGQTLLIKQVEGSDAGVYTCIVHIGINRDLDNAKLIVKGECISDGICIKTWEIVILWAVSA